MYRLERTHDNPMDMAEGCEVCMEHVDDCTCEDIRTCRGCGTPFNLAHGEGYIIDNDIQEPACFDCVHGT